MKIEITDLSKSFDNTVVLKNISLELDSIHSLAIIGPSGGGKTTLLRLMAGLETIDTGEIIINSRNVPKDPDSLIEYRKTVGVVFQSFNLFPHLSAMENITLPLEKVHGVSIEEAKRRAVNLFKRYKLEEHMWKKPHQLSGGQKQRVAIVRALALDTDFILLDEPTSALDPSLTLETLQLIKELKEIKKDLILVTHEIGFAKKVADYVLFISEGIILEKGTPKEIFENPQTPQLQEFLGTTLSY